jgi:hypothetical protein
MAPMASSHYLFLSLAEGGRFGWWSAPTYTVYQILGRLDYMSIMCVMVITACTFLAGMRDTIFIIYVDIGRRQG